VVVRDFDDALKRYDELFGVKPGKVETVPAQGGKAAVLPMAGGAEMNSLK
jgi:hypothetical protein